LGLKPFNSAAFFLHIAQTLWPWPTVLLGRKVDGFVFLEQPNGKYARGKLDEKDNWVVSGNKAYTLECTTGGRQVILWRARGWLQRQKQRAAEVLIGGALAHERHCRSHVLQVGAQHPTAPWCEQMDGAAERRAEARHEPRRQQS